MSIALFVGWDLDCLGLHGAWWAAAVGARVDVSGPPSLGGYW